MIVTFLALLAAAGQANNALPQDKGRMALPLLIDRTPAPVADWLRVSDLPRSGLEPPLRVLPAGEQAELRFLRAFLTGRRLGRQIKTAGLGVVLTKGGAIYGMNSSDGFEKLDSENSSYDGDFATGAEARKSFEGSKPVMVTEMNYLHPGKSDMCYLGVWRVGDRSVVGAFDSVSGITSDVRPLLDSAKPIISVDRRMSIHGPVDPITVVRRNTNGSAEIINLSMDVKKAFPNVEYC